MESKVKSPLVKKISLYINDSLIAEVADVKLKHNYTISGGPGGQLKVVGSVEFEDGTSSTKRLGIKVNSNKKPISMSYELIKVHPHDPSSFTQGLIYDSKEDILIEGSGNYTESRLMKVKLGQAQPIFTIDLDDKYFGEGVTMMNDTIYQLTYKNKKGFYYDREFKLLGEFTYPTEGWGLTHNGKYLIMSDGSANLYFIHPSSFKIIKTLQVFSDKGQVYNLNELEYVNGHIYANIYTSDYIAKIDGKTGRVLALINMAGILKPEYQEGRVDVLNGIAYNPGFASFYVTGKWWPKLFEVRFIEEE
jgi:glutamine cyclotransferase